MKGVLWFILITVLVEFVIVLIIVFWKTEVIIWNGRWFTASNTNNQSCLWFVPSWWWLLRFMIINMIMIIKWSFIVIIWAKSLLQPQIHVEISYSTNIVLFLPINSTILPVSPFLFLPLLLKLIFFNILLWHRPARESVLLKKIFTMKSTVECFTNVVQ